MNQQLCLVFIPALVAILINAEKKKGCPLTETARACAEPCVNKSFRDVLGSLSGRALSRGYTTAKAKGRRPS